MLPITSHTTHADNAAGFAKLLPECLEAPALRQFTEFQDVDTPLSPLQMQLDTAHAYIRTALQTGNEDTPSLYLVRMATDHVRPLILHATDNPEIASLHEVLHANRGRIATILLVTHHHGYWLDDYAQRIHDAFDQHMAPA